MKWALDLLSEEYLSEGNQTATQQRNWLQRLFDRIPVRMSNPVRTSNAEAYIREGLALQRQGRLEEALTTFEQAVKVDPTYADAHTARLAALSALGRATQADQRALKEYLKRIYKERGATIIDLDE